MPQRDSLAFHFFYEFSLNFKQYEKLNGIYLRLFGMNLSRYNLIRVNNLKLQASIKITLDMTSLKIQQSI